MKQGLSAVLLVGALALAGCGGDSQATPEAAASAQQTAEVTTAVTANETTASAAAAPAGTESMTTVAAADAAAGATTNTVAGDTAGAPAAGQPGPGSGAPAGMGPGVMGEITAVDGSTLTVQDQRQQTTVSVLLTDDTQITAQVAVDLANIPVGETVTAMGSQEGDVFTAMRVQVGETGGLGGGPGGMTPPSDGQQPPSDLTPPSDGQQPPSDAGNAGNPGSAGGPPPGGMGGAVISGTVTAAAADGLTITAADGSAVQVVLAADGQATQQAQTTAADLTAGTQIRVQGESDGTTVTATSIQVMPALLGPQP